jgi:putative membrane-bound dehydrogenase-like protein
MTFAAVCCLLAWSPPKSPEDERKTFRLPAGFAAALAAAEPEVVDPIALAFDAHGRMLVVEMPGYPNGGLGIGDPKRRGRIRRLEDRDDDGRYESATVFVDGLRFPTGVCPWRDGVLVGDAPDLLFFADRDDDGRAEVRTPLYTGFGNRNIQQMLNSLQWHDDGWIYGCNGANESTIRSLQKPDAPEVALRGRHFRLRPDFPASLEPRSGGGQYGLSCDEHGRWFTSTNSEHLKQIVLEERYLRHNPFAAIDAVTANVSDHEPACKVFRISPFEEWRVERTSRRAGGADRNRFAASELVPGGYVTSGCGTLVYRGDAFPPAFAGDVFTCDPANNLVHRDRLVGSGAALVGRRIDPDCEFLASTDNWFRPTFLAVGPDGALYVADFYREVIETPLSLPDDIKRRYDLESRERGRIWRVAPADEPPQTADLSKKNPAELVELLGHANVWTRLTAQRLLFEKHVGDRAVQLALTSLVGDAERPIAAKLALGLLSTTGADSNRQLMQALGSKSNVLQAAALRLAEPLEARDKQVQAAALALTASDDDYVRFQLACSMAGWKHPKQAATLDELLAKSPDDRWMQSAVLAAAGSCPGELLDLLAKRQRATGTLAAGLAKGLTSETEAAARLREVVKRPWSAGQAQLFEAFAGARLIKGEAVISEDASAASHWREFLAGARRAAESDKEPDATRVWGVRTLGLAERLDVAFFQKLLAPTEPPAVQMAALQALGRRRTYDAVLKDWKNYSPMVRGEALATMLARPEGARALLTAVQAGRVPAADLFGRRRQLEANSDAEVRRLVIAVFGSATPSRAAVVKKYEAALSLPASMERGKSVFAKHCAACHRIANEGPQVGPDLRAVLANKTKLGLLSDVFDPNRDVDPRYLEYQAQLADGRAVIGLVAAETPAALTLRRSGGVEETVLRRDLEALRSSGISLMPEGLEKNLSPAETADLLEFLLTLR